MVTGAQFKGLLGQSASSQGANPGQHTLNMKEGITVCLSPLGDTKCHFQKISKLLPVSEVEDSERLTPYPETIEAFHKKIMK